MKVGTLEIIPEGGIATRDGRDLLLTRAELCVLTYLAEHPGWFRSRGQIAEHCDLQSGQSVPPIMLRLRRKLGKPPMIETRPTLGWTLRP